MTQFTRKERVMASFLSASPRLKAIIKRIYVKITYLLNRPSYKSLVININKEICLINPINHNEETFYGYYDRSPENNKGLVIFNESSVPSSKKPSTDKPLYIYIIDRNKNIIPVAYTTCYNWQQGCRALWVSDYRMVYNFFDDDRYKTALYDIKCNQIINVYDYPVQDSYGEVYFLSINYSRVMKLRPDYGYRNLPLLSNHEIDTLENDGIWKIEYASKKVSLIVSLETLKNFQPKSTFSNALHKVNHIMISPNGKSFIFIHRWYVAKRRFDRLIYYDFHKLKIIADENMVSHMCWINDNTLFGYLRHSGRNGFYFIDIRSNKYSLCKNLSDLGFGDGHPSVWKNWIVIDTYPDKSRLQHLYLYNIDTEVVYPIIDVFQGIEYQGETRCDLHPRFSPDGKRIYFDTVYSGCRRLACIEVSSITQK